MDILKRDNKNYKVSCVVVSLIIVLGLYLNYGIRNFKIFVGDQGYVGSTADKFDNILGTDMNYDIFNDAYYYVYAPTMASNQKSFLYYLSKYKLNSWRIIVVDDFEDFEEEYKDYDKRLVIIEEDKDIINYVKKNDYNRISDNYYISKS